MTMALGSSTRVAADRQSTLRHVRSTMQTASFVAAILLSVSSVHAASVIELQNTSTRQKPAEQVVVLTVRGMT